MALAVAAGSSAVLAAVPGLATAMKLGGSAYLVYLAWQITRTGALERADVGRPFGLLAAAGFQVLNPKAWIFALGAVTTFRSPELPPAVGSVVVALTMMVVIVPTALLWAGGGGALGRFLTRPRARRVVSLVLAGMLVVTIGLVWV
jgi:threonine/homoserine/homoserine lactone efflux protein